MIDTFGRILFLMLAGHALGDFALQSPYHSAAKRPGNVASIPYQGALGCHALIHGGLVALVTGQWLLGVAETIAHAGIDYGKGRGWYGTRPDQAAHIICKIIWATIAIYA